LAHLNHLRPAARYATTGGLPTDDVTLAFEDSRGDIWIGTREPTTMAVLRRSSNRLEGFSEGEGLPKVTTPMAVTEDLAGNIWIGFREGGLVRYRNGRFELFAEREGLPRSEVLDLFLDHSGRLWIADGAGALLRVDGPTTPKPVFMRYTTAQGLASD